MSISVVLSSAALWLTGYLALRHVGIPYATDLRKENTEIANLYESAYQRARPKILRAWQLAGALEFLSYCSSNFNLASDRWMRLVGAPTLRAFAEFLASTSLSLAVTFVFRGSNLVGHLLGSSRDILRQRPMVRIVLSMLRRSSVFAGGVLLIPVLAFGYLGAVSDVTLIVSGTLLLGAPFDAAVSELDRIELIVSAHRLDAES